MRQGADVRSVARRATARMAGALEPTARFAARGAARMVMEAIIAILKEK